MSSSASKSSQSDAEPLNTERLPSESHIPAETKVETNDEIDRDQTSGQDGEGGDAREQEEEDEGECGFCLFMKAGGCRESFTNWETCVAEAEKNKEDIVEKCFVVTSNLQKCMQAHSDYYAPVLMAEKAAEEEAVKALERESAEKNGEVSVDSSVTQEKTQGS